MMTRVEYLLTVLAEECNEVAQVVSKSNRFGLDDHHPQKDITNRTDMRVEFCELLAVADMLRQEGVELFNFASNADMRVMRDKVERVEKYMAYSRSLGKVE